MNASRRPPEKRGSDPVGEAAERLNEIVRAAERAAAAVIDDAEKQAQRRVDEAQERAGRIVAERLRAIADELDPSGGAAGDSERPQLRSLQPVPEPDEQAGPRRTDEAGARLLATQMAVSGASRGEIAKRLHDGVGIEDPAPLLDAILGPEE